MVTENLKKFITPVFPFTAIVGQEEMKLALQLNVIDPKIGGVMICLLYTSDAADD